MLVKMKRKTERNRQIDKAAHESGLSIDVCSEKYIEGFEEGAEWSDSHPDIHETKKLIDKTCKWLEDNFSDFYEMDFSRGESYVDYSGLKEKLLTDLDLETGS